MAEPAADARPLETSGLEAGAEAAARVLRLFANEHRLRLMCRLADGDHSVGDLARFVGLSQSSCSQHLARLRDEGLVVSRRDNQTIYYRLAEPKGRRIIMSVCDLSRNATEGAEK
ncbi:helix-turn-helix transcriptional regulator [Brevundimonas sp. BAL450]|jgi:ArsR family transcriptional regulator, virulence genes transcriptional regulator|nr:MULTISPECIES: metalloregulator ArsR/SmtB family transcription factor [Brevundimonas]MBG7616073.1 helix-turn-helix transcriptional regulator [Brevundimonas sp. BAL450]